MKKILFLATITGSLLFYSCDNKPSQTSDVTPTDTTHVTVNPNEKGGADTARIIETTEKVRATLTTTSGCNTTDVVDFIIGDIGLLKFCVDKSVGTITVKYNGVCKQTLQVGDTRRWLVYSSAGRLHFKDQPSTATLTDGYPVMTALFQGDFGTDLGLKPTGNATCHFIILGTDDYRHLGHHTLSYNLFNSTSPFTHFIDIKIFSFNSGGTTLFGAYIKQSDYNSATEPSACGSSLCSQGICEDTISNLPACP